jgi:hypothetical protein
LIIFQCMSSTRPMYIKLGVEIIYLEENSSCTPKKPSTVEEKKRDGVEDSINLFLEQALTRQRDEMMEIFSHILQCLWIKTGVYSSSKNFGGTSPFKVQFNVYIPIFEGQIDEDALKKWLNLLEGYFFVHKFSDWENITFALLMALPDVKNWWETYWEKTSTNESVIYGVETTWDIFWMWSSNNITLLVTMTTGTWDGPHCVKRGDKQCRSSPIPSIPCPTSWV